jgi:DNA-binding XRE family transcriptional regulator
MKINYYPNRQFDAHGMSYSNINRCNCHPETCNCKRITYADLKINNVKDIDDDIKNLKKLKKAIIAQNKQVKLANKEKIACWQKGLYKARYMAGYSLSEVAKAINVSKQTIHKWENSKQVIPIQRARQLAKLFSINFMV